MLTVTTRHSSLGSSFHCAASVGLQAGGITSVSCASFEVSADHVSYADRETCAPACALVSALAQGGKFHRGEGNKNFALISWENDGNQIRSSLIRRMVAALVRKS